MTEARQVERLLNRGFEIVQTGETTLASPNLSLSSSFVNVDYSFAFKPIVFAFVSLSSGGTRFLLPYQDVDVAGGADTGKVKSQVSYEVVPGFITFYYRNITSAVSGTAYIRYYICRDPAD